MDRSHPRAFVRGCLVTVAALLAACLSGAPAAAAPLYSLTELPRGRYTSIAPADLNDAGHVVGSARIGGFTDGFLWTPAGGLVEIPHPTDATQVVPQALNNADLVVGYRVGTNLLQKAMTWSPQDPTVRMFGLSGAVQYAPAVNDAGQVAIETYGSNSLDTKDLVRNADGTYRQLADAQDGPPFTGGGVARQRAQVQHRAVRLPQQRAAAVGVGRGRSGHAVTDDLAKRVGGPGVGGAEAGGQGEPPGHPSRRPDDRLLNA